MKNAYNNYINHIKFNKTLKKDEITSVYQGSQPPAFNTPKMKNQSANVTH